MTPEERAVFEKWVTEFNQGLFFECHDTLEDLWGGVRGPSRDFFQGLIQVSVARRGARLPATAVVHNSNHCGIAGWYARRP